MTQTPRLIQLPQMAYRKTTLSNGLDVVAKVETKLPIVSVNLWYHVGSKEEETGSRGFAHLFEHLMFEGSKNHPGDFFKPLQRLGAAVNGSTSSDRTNYFVDLPVAHVETALAMESDRMGNLLPAISEEKLQIQKGVVKNEYLQNYANRPYGMVGSLLAEAMYPSDHPYRWMTIGRMEDVEGASLAKVEAFFRRYYVPGNASLCLAGDLDEDRAFALAERFFGGIDGGCRAPLLISPELSLDRDVDVLLRDRVELERIYLSWHTAPRFHLDDAPLVLLADVLTSGRASRLHRRLVVEEEIAQDVSAWQSGRELAGSFGVAVTIRKGKSVERAGEIVLEELERIANHGVTPDELAPPPRLGSRAFFTPWTMSAVSMEWPIV